MEHKSEKTLKIQNKLATMELLFKITQEQKIPYSLQMSRTKQAEHERIQSQINNYNQLSNENGYCAVPYIEQKMYSELVTLLQKQLSALTHEIKQPNSMDIAEKATIFCEFYKRVLSQWNGLKFIQESDYIKYYSAVVAYQIELNFPTQINLSKIKKNELCECYSWLVGLSKQKISELNAKYKENENQIATNNTELVTYDNDVAEERNEINRLTRENNDLETEQNKIYDNLVLLEKFNKRYQK